MERSELKGSLCGGCAQQMQSFSVYFKELEGIQRKLKNCLKSIHGSMVEIGEEDETSRVRKLGEFKREMMRKPYTSFQFGIVERLRKTTIENCSKLLEASQEDPPQPIVKVEVITGDQDEIPLDISETKYCPPPWSENPGKDPIQSTTIIHKCNLCPKTFPTYRARLAHQRACPNKLIGQPLNGRSNPSIQRIFPEETFILPDALSETGAPQSSSEVITGEMAGTSSVSMRRRFECSRCSKSFSQQSNLKRHQAATHFWQRFRCSYCYLSFSRSGNRNQHMMTCQKRNLCGKD